MDVCHNLYLNAQNSMSSIHPVQGTLCKKYEISEFVSILSLWKRFAFRDNIAKTKRLESGSKLFDSS